MILLAVFLTIMLSLFATAILSYISMAVMIGPWIEPTIVLVATLISAFFLRKIYEKEHNQAIALVTSGASIGGILATACGFSFPTLYFLDPELFTSWLQSPLYFVSFMAGLSFIAGAFGFLVAQFFEYDLLVTEKMEFPVGQIVYRMIFAQNQIKKAIELAAGFFLTFFYGVFQTFSGYIPRVLVLIQTHVMTFFTIPAVKLPMLELPMLWSIGFITGHLIALPLLVGIFSKIFIMSPLHTYYFPHLGNEMFSLAFGGGMIAYGTLIGFLSLPKSFIGFFKNNSQLSKNKEALNSFYEKYTLSLLLQWVMLLSATSAFLFYCDFSLPAQAYLVFFTIIVTYQLLVIGGKMGIAPLGRFATFVLVPGMLLFSFNALQIMLVSTFIEIAGGVGVDVLFGRKTALLAGIERKKVAAFQWLGLVISSLSVGVFFWILITKLGLGSEQLIAQKALNRAMLFKVSSFDFFALLSGALYGAILKDLKVNPMFVLGGILMPLDFSLVLAAGGLSTYLVKDKEAWYPFWSGVFAANSLWMIIRALL